MVHWANMKKNYYMKKFRYARNEIIFLISMWRSKSITTFDLILLAFSKSNHTLIELMTYRYQNHSFNNPNSKQFCLVDRNFSFSNKVMTLRPSSKIDPLKLLDHSQLPRWEFTSF